MKKLLTCLSLILCLIFTAIGCGTSAIETDEIAEIIQQIEADDTADVSKEEESYSEDIDLDEDVQVVDSETDEESFEEEPEDVLKEDGFYTSPEEVALYIHIYGELPQNYITKQEAQALGWVSSEGNLDEVAPGMSIGGNRFGNYEQALPDGDYKECDVNYEGGYRGDERLVYSDDGSIYYTDDHYATFTQLY